MGLVAAWLGELGPNVEANNFIVVAPENRYASRLANRCCRPVSLTSTLRAQVLSLGQFLRSDGSPEVVAKMNRMEVVKGWWDTSIYRINTYLSD